MEIRNLVLVGGPGGGKTTALENIKKYLDERGIPYITVPETATELLANGFNPNEVDIMEFQKLVMQRQLVKEIDAVNYMKKNYGNHEVGVIIYDRGIFDNIAYLNNHEQFLQLLRECNLNEIEVLDRYDMVLDLLSLATCKPDEYIAKKNSNPVRMENLPEAIEKDKKASNAWANHRNIKIVSSDVSLEEETKIILSYVDELIKGLYREYVDYYTIDTEKSNLTKYIRSTDEDANQLYECSKYFDINIDSGNYIGKLSQRIKFGSTASSFILEAYKKRNGEIVKVLDERICGHSREELNKKIGDLSDKYQKISFIQNKLLYRINNYSDRKVLEIHRISKNQKLVLPEGIVVKEQIIADEDKAYAEDRMKIRKKIKM